MSALRVLRGRPAVAAACAASVLIGATAFGPAAVAIPVSHPLGLSPASAHRGEVVTLSGADCGGGGYMVRITVAGDPTPFDVAADVNGDWSTTYTLRNDATFGDHTITAACRDYDDFPYFTYDQATLAVMAPAPPAPSAMTSSGVAPAVQTVTVAIPTGGSVTLLGAGGVPATTVTVPGQGTYVLTPDTGAITFTPAPGFVGVATAVAVRVIDEVDQPGDTTYTPTVLAPDASPAAPMTTTGAAGTTQTATVTVPAGSTITLLDSGGAAATSVVFAGAGTYVLDAATGVITFTPLAGFTGAAPGVTYRLTDQYARTTTATYTATVLDASLTNPAPVAATGGLPETGAPVGPTLALASVLTLVGLTLTTTARRRQRLMAAARRWR